MLSCVGVLYLFAFYLKKIEDQKFSNKILEIIKNSLFSVTSKDYSEQYGDEFNENIQKYREYLNKRVSFGSLFQDTIPYPVAVFKETKKFHWSNKQYKQLELSEETLEGLLVELSLSTGSLSINESLMLTTVVRHRDISLEIFFQKTNVQDEVFYVFYANPKDGDHLMEQEEEGEYQNLVNILEREKIFSSLSEDTKSDELADLIISASKITGSDDHFQCQLESLENKVVDYLKLNNDIEKFCDGLDDIDNELRQRNQKISRNLLKIISCKENLEKSKELQEQRVVALVDYSAGVVKSLENIVSEVFELNELAKKNELSYGQLKSELESIYKYLSSIELPQENLINNHFDTSAESSLESEVMIADLLNEHFKTTSGLIHKLSSINRMVIADNESINEMSDTNIEQASI